MLVLVPVLVLVLVLVLLGARLGFGFGLRFWLRHMRVKTSVIIKTLKFSVNTFFALFFLHTCQMVGRTVLAKINGKWLESGGEEGRGGEGKAGRRGKKCV